MVTILRLKVARTPIPRPNGFEIPKISPLSADDAQAVEPMPVDVVFHGHAHHGRPEART
jgi:hypothetical protein